MDTNEKLKEANKLLNSVARAVGGAKADLDPSGGEPSFKLYAKLKRANNLLGEVERSVRDGIAARFMAPEQAGTKTETVGRLKVKVARSVRYSVDRAALNDTIRANPDLPWDELIRYRPEVNAKNYKALSVFEKSKASDAITSSLAAPTVTVTEEGA